MSEWKKVKLGDCIKEVVEKTTENNQYEVLSVTKDGIYSQEEFFKKQIASENNIGYKVIRKDNLVFSTMNLWMGSLDVLTNYEVGIVSPAYKIFEFNKELMLPEYGNYFMKSYYMLEMYKFCSEQGASIVRRNLDLKQLLGIEINVPSIKQQEKIVKVLNNVDSIIDKYESLLKNKEQFIKSQFVEMFGNPIINDKNINFKEMPAVCEIIDGDRGKNYPKAEEFFEEEYCLFLNAKNVTTNGFSFENCMYITEEKDKKLRNGKLKRGDVVLTTRGTVGNLAFYTEEIPFENVRINSGMVILRMKKDIVNEIFFIEQFKMQLDNIKNKIVNGSAQPQLPIAKMNGIKVLLPDIKLQNQFAEFVKLIDKQKFELEKIINNYKNLKKGLMQQLLTGKIKVKI